MFKIIYKNYIKEIIVWCLLMFFLIGCSKGKKEEASQVIDIENKVQKEDETEKKQKVQEKKLSEMCDWDNARIQSDWYYPNYGKGLILQNQNYIFYPEDGNKIIRINKSDAGKKVIYETNDDKHLYISYCLTDNGLFVEYANNIYFTDFEGENRHKIISCKKLKKKDYCCRT